MDDELTERLLALPLFQGMSGTDLRALRKAQRADVVLRRGKLIVDDYEPMEHLVFVLDGKIQASTKGTGFRLDEMVATPTVLQPECLFGRQTRYTHRFTGYTQTHILRIRKDFVVNNLMKNEVFRFNLVNLICTTAQQREHRLWLATGGTPEQRFTQFVTKRALTPEGTKILHTRMTSLAEALSLTRLRVSKMLASLRAEGKIETRRELIIIPSFERFIGQ